MCLAVPGRIETLVDDGPLARRGKVDFGGVQHDVNLSCVPEAKVGDYVIVHAGMALNVVDEEEAREIFELTAQLETTAEE
ncbi:MAG TPA: HypC/HybG/HupF family hydrogenase formation chaperone [Armatimonadota bacterium]|jgi:hydrogenase expression/formation protein HypC|nr:HypC/HybG/HupF family hydrogenase formation chaperone [Armatimonadota bacterium]